MDRRAAIAPDAQAAMAAGQTGRNSNLKLAAIAAGFVVITVGLIVLQPGLSRAVSTAAPVTADARLVAPEVSLRPMAQEDVVARSGTSLLAPVREVSAAQAVSRQLRQPIRLTDVDTRHVDLRGLAAAVLIGFGHPVHADDPLSRLLVQALSEGQSDAYIDALLNTAAGRGEFTVPPSLSTARGRLDTDVLLQALVRQSAGD